MNEKEERVEEGKEYIEEEKRGEAEKVCGTKRGPKEGRKSEVESQ